MNRTVVRYVLQYALGLGLLGWAVASNWHINARGEDVGLAAALDRPIYVPYIISAAVLSVTATCLTFIRWFLLVRAQGLPFTLRSAFRLGMLGSYFNTFLPGSIGGDVIKAACLAREQQHLTIALATIAVDRVIGMMALFCLALLTGGLMWSIGALGVLEENPASWMAVQFVYLGALLVVLALLGFWVVMRLFPPVWSEAISNRLTRLPRIGRGLASLWQALWMYRQQGGVLVLTIAMALVGHAMQVLGFFCAAASVIPGHEMPSLPDHFMLVPVAFTVQAGIPTPGGVGFGEYIFGFLYSWFAAPFAAGVLGSLAFRVVSWAWAFVGYLTYWRLRSEFVRLSHPAPQA